MLALFACAVGCEHEPAPAGQHQAQAPQAAHDVFVLMIEGGEPIRNPTDDQIRRQLSSRATESDEPTFAILAREEMTYVQVALEADAGFVLEYQEGELARHFQSDRRDLRLEEVIEAFIAYRDGTVDWSRYGSWSRLELLNDP